MPSFTRSVCHNSKRAFPELVIIKCLSKNGIDLISSAMSIAAALSIALSAARCNVPQNDRNP